MHIAHNLRHRICATLSASIFSVIVAAPAMHAQADDARPLDLLEGSIHLGTFCTPEDARLIKDEISLEFKNWLPYGDGKAAL